MSLLLSSISKGFKRGLSIIWLLTKILVPVYLIVTLLKYTTLLDILAKLFSPLMQLFGLPGEASVPIIFGNVMNLYAAIGAAKPLSLSPRNVTAIAIILSFSHSLIVETAITRKIGVKTSHILCLRIGTGIIAGIIYNIFA
ncbi:MAG TPA: nucleoside recognition protein [Thermoanaerobacterales bacterium]|nr:nucleoside recognition protein [Thermoanaerobacterales bacterium]